MTPPWRSATREELATYYRESFPSTIDDQPPHVTPPGPREFALAFRESHPVCGEAIPDRDFVRRSTWETTRSGDRRTPNIANWSELLQFVQHPARNDPLQGTDHALGDPAVLEKDDPVPEAVYYALNHWDRPWVLVVDIDAKDVASERSTPSDVIEREPPAGYEYLFRDVTRAIEYGFETAAVFEEVFAADDVQVVYTGQGVHVYLLDTDPLHRYDERSREVINDLLQETYGIPLDPVVTADRKRLARLPYSLHGDVCRVAQPIESVHFDPVTDAVPECMEVADG